MSLSRRSFLTRTVATVAATPIAAQEVAAALAETPVVEAIAFTEPDAVMVDAIQSFSGAWSAESWMGHGDCDLPPWYRYYLSKLLDGAFTPLEDSPFAPYAETKEP